MLRNPEYCDNDRIIKNTTSCLIIDNIIQDNAILQQKASNIVCGYASPNAFVKIEFNNLTLSTIASDNGRFTVRIPPMSAAVNLQMTISSKDESITFKNIAIGNVYIIAGQSNMEFQLKDCTPGIEVLSDNDLKNIHYFKVRESTFYGKQTSVSGSWITADRETAMKFSGIGAFFAAALKKTENTPVGLIAASIGGVNMESWLSRKSLLKIPEYADEIRRYEEIVSSRDTEFEEKMQTLGDKLKRKLKDLFPENPHDYGEDEGFFAENFDDSSWDSMQTPDNWTQAGHNHAGIFWFRKEIHLPENAENHTYSLHCGAIDKANKTYINGTLVGATGDMIDMKTWNTLRVYDVPQGILKSGRNMIAIQASSLVSVAGDGGLIGPAEEMYLCSEDNSIHIALDGEWKIKETFNAGIEGMTCMRSLGPGSPNSFHIVYDNMIYPLAGIAISGVIWYQGESNAICMAHTYQKLLTAMINDWRDVFENQDLHFYIIQLPEFNTPHYFAPHSQWAKLREAQFLAAMETNSSCIVSLGFGCPNEIHPPNKKPIAEMIADIEHKRLNNLPLPRMPFLNNIRQENNALILTFDGEEIAPDPNGFTIAGKDMKPFKAEAKLRSPHQLIISAAEVDEPVAVWYAWADAPTAHSLKSVNGTPVSPFRATIE